MNTEDDTFRVLLRKPISEIYQDILEQIGAETSIKEVGLIANKHGYTLREFMDYDEKYTLRSKKD